MGGHRFSGIMRAVALSIYCRKLVSLQYSPAYNPNGWGLDGSVIVIVVVFLFYHWLNSRNYLIPWFNGNEFLSIWFIGNEFCSRLHLFTQAHERSSHVPQHFLMSYLV